MKALGFDVGNSVTPITPVMLGDVKLAKEFSRQLFDAGIFAMALGFPTVPKGLARIRVMVSAALTQEDMAFGLETFAKVGKELGVI
jgi:glycine C-acetyltransferase